LPTVASGLGPPSIDAAPDLRNQYPVMTRKIAKLENCET
jgi:hypothetical protein